MTRVQCPYLLSKENYITIISEPLGNIYGFYNKQNNNKFIHINSDVPFWIQNFTVAYELFYALNDLEYYFLTNQKKYEHEALQFAINLLCYEMSFEEFQKLANKDGLINDQHEYYNSMMKLLCL